MKFFLPKKKIFLRTQQNLHDRFFEYSIFKNKWFSYKKKNIYLPNPLSFTSKRPRSLKYLYKERLTTRQKIKNFYGGLSDKKFKQLFKKLKRKNFSIDFLFKRLEQRLDVLLFRSHLFFGLFDAQQSIKHKQIKINGQTVKTVGYKVMPGDCIEVPFDISKFSNNKSRLPEYLGWNSSLNILYLMRLPEIEEINYTFTINKNLIFEYLNNK